MIDKTRINNFNQCNDFKNIYNDFSSKNNKIFRKIQTNISNKLNTLKIASYEKKLNKLFNIQTAIKTLEGTYYFNGNLRQGLPDPSDTYDIGGVSFKYVRPFQSEQGEVITSDGPTTIPLQLVVNF